jgi:hypothetical protein
LDILGEGNFTDLTEDIAAIPDGLVSELDALDEIQIIGIKGLPNFDMS